MESQEKHKHKHVMNYRSLAHMLYRSLVSLSLVACAATRNGYLYKTLQSGGGGGGGGEGGNLLGLVL